MATPAGDDVTRELVDRGRTRVSGLTLGILGALLAVAGFGGGVLFERTAGASTSTTVAGAADSGGATGQGFGAGGRTGRGQFPGGGGGPTAFPTGAAGGFVAGSITKVSGSTITITQADGTTATVKTNGSTSVSLTRSGKVADLAPGNSVIVRGEKSDDGSVTATSIGEGAAGAFGGRGGFRRAGAAGGGNGAAGG